MSLCLSRSWSDCLDSTVSLAIAPCLQPWQPQSLSGLGSLHHREDQSWQLSPSAGLWLVPALPSLASDWSARHASGITSADSSLRISPSLCWDLSLGGSLHLSLSLRPGPAPASSSPASSPLLYQPHSSVRSQRDDTQTPASTLGDTIRGHQPYQDIKIQSPPSLHNTLVGVIWSHLNTLLSFPPFPPVALLSSLRS